MNETKKHYVTTDVGILDIIPNGADSAYITSNGHNLIVNKVFCSASAHVNRINGEWVIQHLWCCRDQMEDISHAGRVKVTNIVLKTISKWAEENALVFMQVGANDVEKQINKKLSEIEKKNLEIIELTGEIQLLRDDLSLITARIKNYKKS